GFLDETFGVRVERGVERAFDVSLADQRLWEPLAVPRCYELAEFDGRTDVLVLSATGVTRRHGGTGAVLWEAELRPSADPKRASTGAVLGLPARCDVAGGATLVVTGVHQAGADGAVPRWVAALAAGSGKLLWRYDLPADWFRAPPGQSVPDSCKWPNLIGVA